MIISLHHSVSVLVDWLISVPSVYYHYGREETDRVTLSASLLHTATSSLHCAVRPLFSPLSFALCASADSKDKTSPDQSIWSILDCKDLFHFSAPPPPHHPPPPPPSSSLLSLSLSLETLTDDSSTLFRSYH